MFEEASVLASSVLKRICDDDKSMKAGAGEDYIELLDMMEAAGMVLVQSFKELGRYPHLFRCWLSMLSSCLFNFISHGYLLFM